MDMFKPEELELLVCGSRKLDFYAWEKAARYIDGYNADHKVIKWFWEVVHEMDDS
jgi:ubiquitin-protein ligase E3 A